MSGNKIGQSTSGNTLALPKSTRNNTLEDYVSQFAITQIVGGTGIDTIPSPIDSGSGVILIADTGITAGQKFSPTSFTVNAQGQLTATGAGGFQKPQVLTTAFFDPVVVNAIAISNVAFSELTNPAATFTVPAGQGFSGVVLVEGQFFIDTDSSEPSIFANIKLSGVDIVGTDRQVYNDRVSGANGSGNENITMKWIINAGIGVPSVYTMGVRGTTGVSGTVFIGGHGLPLSNPAAILTVTALP